MTDATAPIAAALEGHGGHLAAQVLKLHGVDVVFTLSGGHLFPLYDGCVKEEIRLIDVRHEQSAVFAAEGFAKVSRRPGIAALTAGPGVTNGVSAITSAHFTGSPIVVIGGRAPNARWGKGSLQELDHVPIVDSVTKLALTSQSTAEIPVDLERALRAATSAHRGPTFLDVPMDVMFSSAAVESGPGGEETLPQPDPEALERIGRMLAQAERPVLMVGADAYWEGAEHALEALATEAEVPVFMNGLGRGLLPADHQMAFARARSTAFKGADLVIVVGTPLDFRLGFGAFGEAQVVHVMDSSDRIADHVALAASAGGSIVAALDGIRRAAAAASGASHGEWLTTLRTEESVRREKEKEVLGRAGEPIHPGRIYGELRERLDRDGIVIGDGGDFVSYGGKYVDTFTPGCFLDPGPYGCLGTGPGYAIGARLAHPDRQVVLMLGDGAAGFALAELDTLARFQLPVVIVVGNNLCWGLEKHPMQKLYGYHVAAELSPDARYHEVAEALGVAGRQVTKANQIPEAMDWAFDQKGPVLLNVMTDPEDEYPRSSNLG